MIKIYGSKKSSAWRCMWLFEEIGLPYENVVLNFQENEHKSPAYLALNPNGKVPTVVDEDGFVLWESFAINYYFAEKYKPELMGNSPKERAFIDQWSFWAMSSLSPAMEPLILQKYGRPTSDEAATAATSATDRFVKVLDGALAGKEYLVGNRFTMADLNVYGVLASSEFIGYDLTPYANIMAWTARLDARPAMARVEAGA